ncbi:hypothetical protein FHT40_006047 [Mycolicibacterium sp. BK556]|uniref:hypothetical protein n=1 Tax=unclassified Mycolicibacterium TaxID=2636767 RepID=UPI000D342B9B|nr:hypothetical protein [Mycolicibacterium sp. BK556]MBB3636398.1 hypothetical protein [Mycolicibacterium sp. BK607]
MAARPKVHRSEVGRAITMIANRRIKVEDRNRYRLADSPDSDPREVLDYLRKFSGVNIPRWVLQADVCDALTLNNWLWWEDRRRELHFLRAGIDRGLFLSQLGAQVGVGKQGVLDRIDRLEALLRYDRPDEKITRAARRLEREARERAPGELAWVESHRDEIIAVIDGLAGQADRFAIDDEGREWLDELVIDARDDDLRPATMVLLGLASAELRTAPAVLELDSSRPFAVHTVLARADRLRCDFAAIGASEGSGRAVVAAD